MPDVPCAHSPMDLRWVRVCRGDDGATQSGQSAAARFTALFSALLTKSVRLYTGKAIVNKSDDCALRLWNLIKSWNHEYKLYWQLTFFDYLPHELANDFYKTALLETVNPIDKACDVQF